jgi:NitT/TauT family transport system substrate-binding protein
VLRRSIALLTVAAAIAIVTTACGDDDDEQASVTSLTSVASSTSATTTAPSTATGAPDGTTQATSLTTAAAAVSSGPNTPAPRPLAKRTSVKLVSTLNAEAFAALYLADEFGEFDKENLDADVVQLTLPDALPGLIQGNIALLAAGYNAGPLNAIAGGADLKWVASTYAPSPKSMAGMWVRSDLFPATGTFDLCTLRGKRISFGAPIGLATSTAWWFGDELQKCGIGFSDFELSLLAGGDLVTALSTGAVDAGFLPDPLWADPAEKGYAKLVVPQPAFPIGGFIMGPIREKQPDVAAAIVRAMVRASRTYLQGDYRNDPKVRAALLNGLGIPEPLLAVGGSGIFPPDMRMVPDAAEPMQDAWIRAGGILNYSEAIPATDLIDDSIVDRVLSGG